MNKKYFIISAIIIFILSIGNMTIVHAQCKCDSPSEKPLIIKGISIGMDVFETRKIMEQVLSKDWKISLVAETEKLMEQYRFAGGDKEIFGIAEGKNEIPRPPSIGDWGFAIRGNSYDEPYHGYISADKGNNKVTRISFSGKLTNSIFSSSKIDTEDFVKQFCNHYNMPDLNWIAHGWQYASPMGYNVKITTDKLIDIKKEILPATVKKAKIKFDL